MALRRLVLVVAAVLAVALTVGVVLVAASPERTARNQPPAQPSASAPQRAEQDPTTLAARPPRPACDRVRRPFTPREISVPGATRGAGIVTPPRDANGIPGTPPLTTYGKSVFAWDTQQGTRPGGKAGNVLLNAHTWPDGSALGNRLLAGLQLGDRIVVHGAASTRLCYRVSERVEVLASKGLARYYDRVGPPQLAIVVCSGRRLGPGDWEKRTIWFARPAA